MTEREPLSAPMRNELSPTGFVCPECGYALRADWTSPVDPPHLTGCSLSGFDPAFLAAPAKVSTKNRRARVLYFLMGLAAVLFVAADVVAEFDRDPDTHTATSYVKAFRKRSIFALLVVAAFPAWLALHFLWDGFPL